MWEIPPLDELKKTIADPSSPIGKRMRAAYHLRQLYLNDDGMQQQQQQQEAVIEALAAGLVDKRHGSLLRHEFAYVMGQLRDERCCDTLEAILTNTSDCVMVRHEAAEALGAIGASRSQTVLEEVMDENTHCPPELTETCQLALNVMEWRASGGDPQDMPAACACMLNPYSSVDPAPPDPLHENKTFKELGDILCDAEQRPIFERYRAMFSLRNRGGVDAVQELCRALTTDKSSALLRHEVAYVLGQMQHPASVEALEESLRRTDEHQMVRHESAEALGAIDGRWEDVERILQEFSNDENDVVRESCIVALDAANYWGHNNNNNNHEDNEDDVVSFAHQKSDQRILVNHFNVKD